MKTLRLLLGDQLNASHPWFDTVSDDIVYLMAEMRQETDYAPPHIQKVLAFFAAMRAFAEARQAEGHRVIYLSLDDPANTQGLEANVRKVMADEGCERFEYQLPDEWRLDHQLKQLAAEFKAGTLIARLDTTKGLAEYFEWSVRMHSGVYHSHGAGAAVAMFANK